MSVPGIVTVSCLLLTNDVVRDVPFHTTTELLLKLPPFTVRTKPAPPAVALLGESELTDGVDGQEQETAGSKKIANAPKRGRPFIVEPRVTPHCRVAIWLPTDHASLAQNARVGLPSGLLAIYGPTLTWIEFEVTVLLPLK